MDFDEILRAKRQQHEEKKALLAAEQTQSPERKKALLIEHERMTTLNRIKASPEYQQLKEEAYSQTLKWAFQKLNVTARPFSMGHVAVKKGRIFTRTEFSYQRIYVPFEFDVKEEVDEGFNIHFNVSMPIGTFSLKTLDEFVICSSTDYRFVLDFQISPTLVVTRSTHLHDLRPADEPYYPWIHFEDFQEVLEFLAELVIANS